MQIIKLSLPTEIANNVKVSRKLIGTTWNICSNVFFAVQLHAENPFLDKIMINTALPGKRHVKSPIRAATGAALCYW